MVAQDNVVNHPDGSVSVVIDTRIYPIAVVKKSAYRLADRASFNLSSEADCGLTVTLNFPKETDTHHKGLVVDDFLNELIDQDLRETIRTETEATRTLILANAFSKTNLLG